MKRIVLGILMAGCWAVTFATDARVATMGGRDNFFMDEVSIFKNPANINIYPNMVYGSFGVYRQTQADTANVGASYPALQRTNRDPTDPFFGAIVSYSLNQNSENRNQYPMFSLGAVFNRQDDMLDYITPGAEKFMGDTAHSFLAPTGKVDLLGGYVLQNGGMIGISTYLAFQDVSAAGATMYESSILKINAGINLPIAKSTNLEVSVGGGMLNSQGRNKVDSGISLASNDMFVRGDVRLFSALTLINGDFVPHLGVQQVNLYEGRTTLNDVNAGFGINVNIDKGFFWAGVEGLYKDYTYVPVKTLDSLSTENGIGGRVSFGIERSIWRDWFVIRVGGQKVLMYNNTNRNGVDGSRWEENPASDASDHDLVSLGFGLNVENRLRVDFVAAEDVPYTFTNLVSGPQHHLFTRVSATYSF
ncbi:MAG: hypothetical protein MUF22_00585 [Chitinispirillaceae bacterium]|jgi:hypothetical protein|nr:hypothetical protein [Chitinispirillaceae bacterium]